jgi:tyrosyl-tRNA synthetase
MTAYKSEFLKTLQERGYIHQCTDETALDEAASKGPICAYIGFDCTAPSLHAGSLLGIMMLRKLQQTGHKPIVLMGGGTTKVGDPSGKDESRQLLTSEDIAANMEGIRAVFSRFLTFGNGPTDAIMVNNADWLDGLNYIDFLRDYGTHFTINRMLSFDSVKMRLEREHPLTFLEFNYMILQAYDFLELNRRHKCTLQMGGSDQWGNIVNGIELGRRVDSAELYGLTTALLTTSSGAKMGKTAAGAVWLNADMLKPYDYWQYWRNSEDADVGRFLRLFTELSLDEIEKLEKLEGAELNEAKKILATRITAMAHGDELANAAEETARQTFEQGAMAQGLPTHGVTGAQLKDGIGILTLLVDANLAASNGEARRAISNNAIAINDTRVTDPRYEVSETDLIEGALKLSFGKKRHLIVKPE